MRQLFVIAVAGMTLAVAGCNSGDRMRAPTASHATVTDQTKQSVATITAIDRPTRMVTLRTDDGEDISVVASDDIKNLDQLKVGDHLVVTYRTALAARMQPSNGVQSQVTETIKNAPAGSRPGTQVERETTLPVRIVAVDTASMEVTFVGPSGQTRKVLVLDPEMQAFARTLKPGDQVQITYTEALALSAQPAPM